MSNSSFIFQGRIYNATVGEIITLKEGIDFPDNIVKITTAEYIIYAEKIAYDEGKLVLKISKVLPLTSVVNVGTASKDNVIEPQTEEPSVVPPVPNITKYTKAQLLDLAEELNIKIPNTKITKKEIIELINNR